MGFHCLLQGGKGRARVGVITAGKDKAEEASAELSVARIKSFGLATVMLIIFSLHRKSCHLMEPRFLGSLLLMVWQMVRMTLLLLL